MTPLEELRDAYVAGRISLATFEARVALALADGKADDPGASYGWPGDDYCRAYAEDVAAGEPVGAGPGSRKLRARVAAGETVDGPTCLEVGRRVWVEA